jgi:hypothetical protein
LHHNGGYHANWKVCITREEKNNVKALKKLLVLLLTIVFSVFLVSCAAASTEVAGYIQFYVTSDQSISFSSAGEKFVVTYSLQPKDAEIQWRTDDETVATVDENGVITAVGHGKCTIYARIGTMTSEGQVWDSYVESKITVSCDFA